MDSEQKYEQIQAMFEELADTHGEFKNIPEAARLHPSRRLCGYLKISQLMTNPADFSIHAEHDQVWLCELGELRDDITKEDVQYLSNCGIFFDDEVDSLSHFT